MVLEERALLSSRLAALISLIQSSTLLAEGAADMLAGRSCMWAVIALLEGWVASCRLRLLALQEPEHLMVSSGAAASSQDRWSLAFRKIRAGMRPGAPLGAACSQPCAMQRQADLNAAASRRLGEVIHILQPVLHLLVLRLTRSCAGSAGDPRLAAEQPWAPWLSAVLVEVLSLRLCSLGTPAGGPSGASNKAELRHRHGLLFQLFLRPVLRALVHALLRRAALRLPLILRPACERAIQLVGSLDMVCPRLIRYGGN